MQISRRILIPLSFVAVALVAYIGARNFLTPNQSPLSLTLTEQTELNSIHLTKLSPVEYLEYESLLRKIVTSDGPEAASERLKGLIRERKIRKDCNNLTYQIGLAAFEKYPDLHEALTHVDQLCGYGEFHGVLGGYFSDLADPLTQMETVCGGFDVKREEMECYHAVGHSMMERSSGDISASRNMCDNFIGETAKSVCGLGIFHELFQPHAEHHLHQNGEIHNHDYVDVPEDALGICERQPDPYRLSCYKLAPRKFLSDFPDGVRDVLNWCQRIADVAASGACTRGAIGDVMQYIYRYKTLENICISGAREQILPCISEIVFNKLSYTTKEMMADVCKKEFSRQEIQEVCLYAVSVESRE